MANDLIINIPNSCYQLKPGCKVKLNRFTEVIWVLNHGWYTWGGNRSVCGWYLTDTASDTIKPLQLTDLDDIYIITS